MNGHFEVEQSNYPISAMRHGDAHKVTDMRSLQPLHSQPISKELAYKAAAVANAKVRAGELPQDIDSQEVKDYVEAYLDERIGE